jgi:hypothetical protein
MSKHDNLIEIGDIYHSERGTDETWATLYFDTGTCDLVVVETSDTTGMYPRYSPSGRSDVQMTLQQFLANHPSYRERVIRLVTEKLAG